MLHDSDLMKVAGVDLKIWDATRAGLAGIDIGSWFGPEFHGERVPCLREVLERARGRGRVMIELKYYGHDENLEQRVVDLVEELGQAGRRRRHVARIRPGAEDARAPAGLDVGLLTAKAVGDLTALDADFLAVNAGLASRGFVQRAHARGKKVYVWTINDPVQMFRMLNLGVDGIITDRPAVARWVIERRSRAELGRAPPGRPRLLLRRRRARSARRRERGLSGGRKSKAGAVHRMFTSGLLVSAPWTPSPAGHAGSPLGAAGSGGQRR